MSRRSDAKAEGVSAQTGLGCVERIGDSHSMNTPQGACLAQTHLDGNDTYSALFTLGPIPRSSLGLFGREDRPGPPYSYFGGSSRSSLPLGMPRSLEGVEKVGQATPLQNTDLEFVTASSAFDSEPWILEFVVR